MKFWILLLVMMVYGFEMAYGAIDVEHLANSIYIAEGGDKTNHPYGILKKYKTTTPRQACINTINHALRDWNHKGDFIEYLGKRYAPEGVTNDPNSLNKNWVKNVSFYYYGGYRKDENNS